MEYISPYDLWKRIETQLKVLIFLIWPRLPKVTEDALRSKVGSPYR